MKNKTEIIKKLLLLHERMKLLPPHTTLIVNHSIYDKKMPLLIVDFINEHHTFSDGFNDIKTLLRIANGLWVETNKILKKQGKGI